MDLEFFRKKLLEKQKALLDVEETLKETGKTVELDQSRVGRLSRMDALQGQAMSQAAQHRRQQELQRISNALHRIETEDYGYCLACGEPINEKRLEFDPSATLCIQCAEKSDTTL